MDQASEAESQEQLVFLHPRYLYHYFYLYYQSWFYYFFYLKLIDSAKVERTDYPQRPYRPATKIFKTMPSSTQTLKLYRAFQRAANKFPDYNYREYIKRRARDAFASSRSISNPQVIFSLYQQGIQELEIIHRQAIVNALYSDYHLKP